MRPARESRRAILILGMHRSGTSALARVLGLCGGTLPRDTWSPDEHNASGYWEPATVVALHDEILRSLDSSFDDLGVPPPGWQSSVAASGFGERLAEALEGAYGDAPLWVVKDPRMCRLVPLWKDVLARLEVAPLAVIPFRNPLEVAASLAERDGLPVAKSLLLWLRHFLEAEVATRGMPRSFVSYEALLQDWRRVVHKIGSDLAVSWPSPPESVAPQVESFLDPRGRHHVRSERAPAAHPEVSAWVGTVYDWAVEAARHQPPATARIDAVRESLSVADTTFLPLLSEFKRDRSRLEERSSEALRLAGEVRSLQANLARAEEEGQSLKSEREERGLRIAALEAALEASRSESAAMRTDRDRLASEAGRLAAALHDVEAALSRKASEIEALRHEVAGASRRGEQLAASLASATAETRALRDEAAGSERRAHDLEARLERERADSETLRGELSRQAAGLRTLEAALAEARAATHGQAVRAEELRARWLDLLLRLHSIHASAAWQLSAPLRWMERLQPVLARGLMGFPKVILWALTGRLTSRLRIRQQARLILRSGLFDERWYAEHQPDVVLAGGSPLAHYLEQDPAAGGDPNPLFDRRWYAAGTPDLAASRIDPLAHYVLRGAGEGRNPNPLFDSDWYLQGCPDAKASGMNPLVHFLHSAGVVGRGPSPLFDSDWYLGRYPDVKALGMNPLVHFLHYGGREGRDPNPLFDSAYYLRQAPEIAASGANPLVHYLESGAAEGRDPNPLFDADWYLRRYPDVAASGLNPLAHFLHYGGREGRDPNPLFDSGYYLRQVPAIAAAGANPLVHYLESGAAEGRRPNPLFDADWYVRRYPDVAASGLNPLAHFLHHGGREGRDPHPLFDSACYLRQVPEIAAVGANPLVHYLESGEAEGRDPNPLFDTAWYLRRHPDVAESGVNPLVHYLESGAAEGQDPNALFDGTWYLKHYPDVAAAGANPLVHYLESGAAEGRDPNPLFDAKWYLWRYPDVAASGMNPLAHFLQHGGGEGRDPHPLFDSGYYLRQGPDIATAGGNPLIHYLESGAVEGRDPSPLFDTGWYLRRHPDVAESGVNPLVHYLEVGAAEGRDPNPLFHGTWYLKHYPDVAASRVNPLAHFLWFGAAEGRDPNPLFVTDWYRSRYPDVAASGINPLVHYLEVGAAEGRDPSPLFDAGWYRRRYPDAAKWGGNPLVHYLEVGAAEGRDPNPLFDGTWYLKRYPDVAESGVNPLVHYLESGAAEGRDPTPLFDGSWYLKRYPDVAAARVSPLAHFLRFGPAEGRDPNPLFDTDWYLQRYLDVAASGVNPLVHYLEHGAAEGRDPNPLFDGSWYLKHYPDVAAARVNPLAHFIQFGAAEGRDPNPFFVTDWYCKQYPDVAASGVNPLIHYLLSGATEGRDPSPLFDTDWYASRIPDAAAGQNPLAHYLHVGRSRGGLPRAGASQEAYVSHVLSSPTARDAGHRDFVPHEPIATELKLLAFYLPQFHPIPENDRWWGRGFTEWTNVSRAVPQFVGHYQPRLPGELGFYDLRMVEVQRRQVELARNYGIHGFCFHFYWFGGKRLLERPLDQFVADTALDFPFCVCWANENWSRRWDGSEQEVLIAQEHSPEDDEALIGELSRFFTDRRYVRVGGKPLLIVYRVDILPDAAATAQRWRKRCRELGFGEIFLAAAQSFGIDDPRPFGFDAAVEFPPHGAQAVQPITSTIEVLNPSFAGDIFSFDMFAELFKRRRPPAYPLFRTVCPSWDNSARMLERARVYHGSTPDSYRDWLEAACRFADAHPVSSEKLVFINAWNEWSEGAYLEPDRRHGHAYLEATREGLSSWSRRPPAPGPGDRVLVVTHNSLSYGAQQIALHIARTLNRDLHFEVDVVDQGIAHYQQETIRYASGELTPRFEREGRVHALVPAYAEPDAQRRLFEGLRHDGVKIAICNTTVTGPVVEQLSECGFRVLSLVHELPSLMRECGLEPSAQAIARHAEKIVFPSDLARQGFLALHPEAADKAVTRHQGLYNPPPCAPGGATREERRRALGLPADHKVVLGVGSADIRKGFDLFVRVAARLAAADERLSFVWLGCEIPMLRHWARHDAERLGFSDRLHLLPRVDDVHAYYAASDLLLLPSREDPFPSVVLEALSHGVPVVAFEGATGSTELLRRGCGATVPYADDAAMAEEARRLLSDDASRETLGKRGQAIVADELDWRDYVYDLLAQLGEHRHRVSVVVPNYNYARHLTRRLESIFAQSYPVYEVIVLDDASTDDSVALVRQLQAERGWELKLHVAEVNSGSVFEQWRRGVEMARGDLVWIAEADDWAEVELLSTLASRLDDPEVVLAYSESCQVDEEGRMLAPNYLDYVKDVDPEKWHRSWARDARDELREALVVKNTIPNVSAAVFRREALRRVLQEEIGFIRGFRVAGDYASYVRLLSRGGKVAFASRALNHHRRHSRGVTIQGFGLGLVVEIARLQTEVYDLVGASPEAAVKAGRYMDELSHQFRLVPDGQSWALCPELSELARHPLYSVPERAATERRDG